MKFKDRQDQVTVLQVRAAATLRSKGAAGGEGEADFRRDGSVLCLILGCSDVGELPL